MNSKRLSMLLTLIFSITLSVHAPFIEENIEPDLGQYDVSTKKYLPTTVDVAADQKFFPFMYELRSRANAYLNEILHEMRMEIYQAKMEGRMLFAQGREAFYHQLYRHTSDRIDLAFNKISKILVLEGDFLDDNNAPESQKRDLVIKTKELAHKLILPLLAKKLATLRREQLNP